MRGKSYLYRQDFQLHLQAKRKPLIDFLESILNTFNCIYAPVNSYSTINSFYRHRLRSSGRQITEKAAKNRYPGISI